jgi:hypothetical protein
MASKEMQQPVAKKRKYTSGAVEKVPVFLDGGSNFNVHSEVWQVIGVSFCIL